MNRQSKRSEGDDAEAGFVSESAAVRDAVERLRGTGQRVTMQRVAILSALGAGEHLSADEVFERIAPAMPLVNRSTVFRALEHFRDTGFVSQVDVGDGLQRFELLVDERHHHLICLDCRHAIVLDDDLVEPLRRAIEDRHSFRTRIDHLALFGLCAVCDAKRRRGSAPSAN